MKKFKYFKMISSNELKKNKFECINLREREGL